MEHPFLKNIKLISLYIITWIIYSVFYIFWIQHFFHVPLSYSVIDSVTFNSILSLLCLAIWYVIRFEKPGRKSIVNTIIGHITTVTLCMLIWIGLSFMVFKILLPADSVYLKNFHATVPLRMIEGLFSYAIITLIYYLIIYNRNIQEQVQHEALMQEKINEAELNLLKSQINPHFLFNSLNSVSSLTMSSPEKAQEMIIKLSDYLRYSVSDKSNSMSVLSNELENINRYLDIEKVRFGNRLFYTYNIADECKKMIIPAMILQPLYENAVKHGVYESIEPVEIITNCYQENNILFVNIINNFDPEARVRKGTGIGLTNIRERLKLIYKNEQLIKTEIKENKFEVLVMIPQI